MAADFVPLAEQVGPDEAGHGLVECRDLLLKDSIGRLHVVGTGSYIATEGWRVK